MDDQTVGVGGGNNADGNLYDIVEALQSGDRQAGWNFTEHFKIKAIIRSRLNDYRRQFTWISREDLEDVEHGLRPRLIDIALRFTLSEMRNEGRVVAYFKLRIKGEADFLLKHITGMRQVSDEDGNLFLRAFNQPLDGVEDIPSPVDSISDVVVDGIEDARQSRVMSSIIASIRKDSNDQVWLQCYILRLQDKAWFEIAQAIGYKQTDYAYIKDNTARFVNRVKHRLLLMGEKVSMRICGIYTDDNDVGICVIDTVNPKNFVIWSKTYEEFADLDKVEGKLGDVFRQFDITYVIMNAVPNENRAFIICMRYLTKREAFVETVDGTPFFRFLREKPETIRGFPVNEVQRRAYQLAEIKRAHIDCIRNRSNPSGDFEDTSPDT